MIVYTFIVETESEMGAVRKACWIDAHGRVSEAARNHSVAAVSGSAGGCIRIDAIDRVVHIAVSAKAVSPSALAGMMYFLHDYTADYHPNATFCLTDLTSADATGAVVEVFGSIKQTCNRVQFLVDEQSGRQNNRFVSRSLPLSSASRIPVLARVLDAWKTQKGAFNDTILRPILADELEGRYCVLERSKRRSGFAIIEIGAGLHIPYERFTQRFIGADLSSFPDGAYANWLTIAYRNVMDKGAPRYDEISAHIFYPDTGLVARRYRRLLIPWLSGDGRQLLLSINRPL